MKAACGIIRACMEVAFRDKKCLFFDEARRFLKCIPEGTDEKSNAVSSKKGHFSAQRVISIQALKISKPAFRSKCKINMSFYTACRSNCSLSGIVFFSFGIVK